MPSLRSLTLFSAATLVVVVQMAIGAAIPGAEIERTLSEIREAPQLSSPFASSSGQGASSSAGHGDFGWESMVHEQDLHNPYAPKHGVEATAWSRLDTDMDLLRLDWNHISKYPYHELSFPQRKLSLQEVKAEFFRQSETRLQDAPETVTTFQPGSDPQEFATFMDSVARRDKGFGMWRMQVGDRHFLLAQLNVRNGLFNSIHGYNADRHHIILGVWQEIGGPGSNIYQYLGAFRGAHSRPFVQYRTRVLSETVKPIDRVRMLGSSSVYMKLYQ
ncbi:hypothetical protein PaG_04724 [Moesziomyces aphidis]|jgi:hypothetical protein|uniref:Uncharacterized protein n=1 Tax=Moesziomyces aphidis TaxID=84754 RepID=W3VJ40_MOEAP|nr:hypothetical protein PaG_04724 [Moesziomyces aphidis]